MPELVTGFALVAVVLVIAGLASGLMSRAPTSFPIIFLGLGFLLGEHGLAILTPGPEDALLESVATLVLVLCLEGIRIGSERGTGGAGAVPILSLGPGTAIITPAVAVGAYFLLAPSLAESLLRSVLSWAAWTPEASAMEDKPVAMMVCTLDPAVGAGS